MRRASTGLISQVPNQFKVQKQCKSTLHSSKICTDYICCSIKYYRFQLLIFDRRLPTFWSPILSCNHSSSGLRFLLNLNILMYWVQIETWHLLWRPRVVNNEIVQSAHANAFWKRSAKYFCTSHISSNTALEVGNDASFSEFGTGSRSQHISNYSKNKNFALMLTVRS